MVTDQEQTKLLRHARLREKQSLKEQNRIGKRLEWVRSKLELSQRQVCDATGIPASSYCGREGGIRAELAEEYLVLALFYDKLWKQKFLDGFPMHNGQEVSEITVQWILFGEDENIIEQYRERIKEIEFNYFTEEVANQLDMFKAEEE
jgi:transcriptional regulator with XRE-family HTH domain